MFANPNIAAWVVERLPCTFAKPKPDGSAGTHYAMVLLDKNGNVLYIGSQCEHENGEGIQALHELGEANDTCFTSSAAFRKILGKIHASTDHLGELSKVLTVEDTLPPMLRTAMGRVWNEAANKHNKRRMSALADMIIAADRQDLHIQGLNRILNRVVYNILNLHPMIDHGAHQDRVHNTSFAKNELKFERIFQIRRRPFSEHDLKYTYPDGQVINGVKLKEPGNHVVMVINNRNDIGPSDNIFAVRDIKPGAWSFDPEPLKRWASDNYTVFNNMQKAAMGLSAKDGKDYCLFCGDWFERMSRHIGGGKHIDRVVEVGALACKATSHTGLKLLNNPRYRTAFIKDRP